jgi:DNA-directed RNA polymerase subunit N (RpoN/RPB10)
MRINCLSCGHSLDVHHDYDDYEGQIKCFVCGALLSIHSENGRIKHVVLDKQIQQEKELALHG